MFACNLSIEIVDLGIELKCLLNEFGYERDATSVDYFLCQYDCKCVNDKEELIDSMLEKFNWRRCAEMFVSDETLQCIKKYCSLLEELRNRFSEIYNIGFHSFQYNNKEYLVNRDIFNWVITRDQIIFLIKEKGKYIEDNLVSLNNFGDVLWDSKKCIDCPNRMGTVFVGLNLYDESTIVTNAYVGVNYFMDIKTGTVTDSKITK